MKKYFLLFLSIVIYIGLLIGKYTFVGIQIFILSCIVLIISYIYQGVWYSVKKQATGDSRILCISLALYLIFTLTGIYTRHTWIDIPYWIPIFRYVWPVCTGVILALLFLRKKEIHKPITLRFLIPMALLLILAIPTYFTSPKTFCDVFKNFKREELDKGRNANSPLQDPAKRWDN